jgi:hypothetical protein
MSLKIIGAGFGRTGTLSLQAALQELGFAKCHHMMEMFKHPSKAIGFLAAVNGEPVDWDDLLDGYQATVDWPCCTFYKELMIHSPDAKVILSVRDPERWYASAFSTIYRASLHAGISSWIPIIKNVVAMIQRLIWDGTFDGRFSDKSFAIEQFQRHNQEVLDTVPAEKLLVFEVTQGWEPLCKFLDVPMPNTPFPHLNDKKSFERIITIQRFAPWALGAGLAITALIILNWLL